MFLRLREEWGVPFEVANDGDITALAGAMSLGVKGVLGIAMGSSEAAGYLDAAQQDLQHMQRAAGLEAV